MYKAFQKAEERDAVISAFTERDDIAQVMITIYVIEFTSLNLQQKCWRVHMLESAHNLEAQIQALGRALRYGNFNAIVWLYEYYVD